MHASRFEVGRAMGGNAVRDEADTAVHQSSVQKCGSAITNSIAGFMYKVLIWHGQALLMLSVTHLAHTHCFACLTPSSSDTSMRRIQIWSSSLACVLPSCALLACRRWKTKEGESRMACRFYFCWHGEVFHNHVLCCAWPQV